MAIPENMGRWGDGLDSVDINLNDEKVARVLLVEDESICLD